MARCLFDGLEFVCLNGVTEQLPTFENLQLPVVQVKLAPVLVAAVAMVGGGDGGDLKLCT